MIRAFGKHMFSEHRFIKNRDVIAAENVVSALFIVVSKLRVIWIVSCNDDSGKNGGRHLRILLHKVAKKLYITSFTNFYW